MHVSETADGAALIGRAEELLLQRDFASAGAIYDIALTKLRGRDEPAVVRALVGRGWASHGLGDDDLALQSHQAALRTQLRIAPKGTAAICAIRKGIGAALVALGRLQEGEEQYQQVLASQRDLLDSSNPEIAETLNILGETAARQDQFDEARRYQEAALGILRIVCPPDAPEIALALTNLGGSLFRLDLRQEAEITLREALTIDPNLLLAAENLIHVLYRQGRKQEARALAADKYRRQSFVVQPMPARPSGTLLVLWSLDGNIPKHHLLARLPLVTIDWHIEYANDAHERRLPPYDLVFNLIGDADGGAAALECAVAFERRCGVRLLNEPRKVQRTRRHMIPDLLAGIDDLVIPRVAAFPAAALKSPTRASLLTDAGLDPPLLLRSAGKHGGETLERKTTEQELAQHCSSLPDDEMVYVTAYHDYVSPDRFYRKYRAVFVDGALFPYHLAISPHWLVHYFSASMEDYPWKLAEEQAYLENASVVLGERAMAALTTVGQQMGLHYCGVDFSLLPDGRVLLFEANATMLVHPEDEHGALARKNPHVARILSAFDHLIWRNLPDAKRWPLASAPQLALA
jgi:tetratricopeptide (TPR) repeat protein